MEAILRPVRQTVRGCTKLPHVGGHPGTTFLVLIVVITALAGGYKSGLPGILFGGALAGAIFGTIYAMGAWSRAEISDRILRRHQIDGLLQDWTDIAVPDDRPFRIGMRLVDDAGRIRVHVWRDSPPYGPDVPDWLAKRIDQILMDRQGNKARRMPSEQELKGRTLQVRKISAHEQLAARARLAAATSLVTAV